MSRRTRAAVTRCTNDRYFVGVVVVIWDVSGFRRLHGEPYPQTFCDFIAVRYNVRFIGFCRGSHDVRFRKRFSFAPSAGYCRRGTVRLIETAERMTRVFFRRRRVNVVWCWRAHTLVADVFKYHPSPLLFKTRKILFAPVLTSGFYGCPAVFRNPWRWIRRFIS